MKVLLVEDEPKVRRALRKLLTEIDPQIDNIIEADSGDEGLRLITEEQPDIVLLDMIMPGMHGDELLDRIRTMKLEIPVIVVSGYHDFALVRQALANDAIDYILKPFDKEDVAKALNKAKERLEKVQFHYRTEQLVQEMQTEQSTRQMQAVLKNVYIGCLNPQELVLLPSYVRKQACALHLIVIRNYEDTLNVRFLKDVALLEYAINKCISEYTAKHHVVLMYGISGRYGWCIWVATRSEASDVNRWKSDGLLTSLEQVLKLSCTVLHHETQQQVSGYAHAIAELENRVWYMNLIEGAEAIAEPSAKLVEAAEAFIARIAHALKHRLSFRISEDVEQLLETASNMRECSIMFLFRVWTNMNAKVDSLMGQDKDRLYPLDRVEDFALRVSFNVDKAKELFISALQHELLESRTSGSARHKENRALAVKEYIDFEYREPLSLADLAQRFYLSKEYLAAQFKQQFGITVVHYIHEVRLHEARRLLEESDEAVSAIALSVGYDHFSYFNKRFKERYSITPSEYRLSSRSH